MHWNVIIYSTDSCFTGKWLCHSNLFFPSKKRFICCHENRGYPPTQIWAQHLLQMSQQWLWNNSHVSHTGLQKNKWYFGWFWNTQPIIRNFCTLWIRLKIDYLYSFWELANTKLGKRSVGVWLLLNYQRKSHWNKNHWSWDLWKMFEPTGPQYWESSNQNSKEIPNWIQKWKSVVSAS